eukprot:757554_1
MAAEQKTTPNETEPNETEPNKTEPNDEDIMKMSVKQLKTYTKKNKGDIALHKITEKNQLRFMALDSVPSGWTKQRVKNLAVNCRRYFIEDKIKKPMKDNNIKYDESVYLKYIEPKDEYSENDINLIIDNIIEIINKYNIKLKNVNDNITETSNYISKTEDIHSEDEDEKNQKALIRNNTNDNNNDNDNNNEPTMTEMSSVSTHDSMPSLMSDDESDDNDDFDNDDSDSDTEDDISDENETKKK